jgi:hypothetical protein
MAAMLAVITAAPSIRDSPFAFDHLTVVLGYFATEFVVLSLPPLVFPVQRFPAGLIGMPMAIRRCPLSSCAASRSCTHPPYDKRFPETCPVNSQQVQQVPELLRPKRVNREEPKRSDIPPV